MLFKAWKDIFLAVESESKDERCRKFGHSQADKTETMIKKNSKVAKQQKTVQGRRSECDVKCSPMFE